MKTPRDPKGLLDDVLLDDQRFAESSLAALLGAVRHRQVVRRRRRAMVAMVVLLLGVSAWIWMARGPHQRPVALQPQDRMPGSLEIVQSHPARAGLLTDSRPTLTVVTTTSDPARIVSTAPQTVPRIDDTELFALLGGRPAALIRSPAGAAALVLVREADRLDLGLP